MGARETKGDAALGEEVAKGRGEELPTVVALHALNLDVELGENVVKETVDGGSGVGLVS